MAKTNYSPTFPMFPGDAAAVTPSDTQDLPEPSIIYVGNVGAVKVTTAQGTEVTFIGVPSGSVIPVQVRRVWSAGTTASDIVRIF
jgi:hypothetical protein